MNPEAPDLFRTVLASVSRSFYLTIQVLPKAVRRPVGLAYLLARTSDTIADSAGVPVGERLEALACFQAALEQGGAPGGELTERLDALRAGVTDPAEQRLLDQVPRLIPLYAATPTADRAEIRRVLEVIFSGQELDLQRTRLETAEELDDYTYRVAGCVGEFWTRISMLHLPHYSRQPLEAMIPSGIALGKGLQLVNILRDAPTDFANGRCYLPVTELAACGVSPEEVLSRPAAARPVMERWIGVARAHFDEATGYLREVRPWRLRLACFLPWAIGLRTLRLLEERPPLETAERVKVSRREVRRLLWTGLGAAFSQRVIDSFHQKNH